MREGNLIEYLESDPELQGKVTDAEIKQEYEKDPKIYARDKEEFEKEEKEERGRPRKEDKAAAAWSLPLPRPPRRPSRPPEAQVEGADTTDKVGSHQQRDPQPKPENTETTQLPHQNRPRARSKSRNLKRRRRQPGKGAEPRAGVNRGETCRNLFRRARQSAHWSRMSATRRSYKAPQGRRRPKSKQPAAEARRRRTRALSRKL